jgi:sigma-B regulation protein RsbU (phosphoserine phosphatase)
MSQTHLTGTNLSAEQLINNETQVLELQSLFEISQLLSKSIDLKSVLNNIMYTIMGRLMISKSAIVLYNAEKHTFFLANSKGLKTDLTEFPFEEYTENDFLISEHQQSKLNQFLLSQKLALGIPLHNDGKTIGVFALGNKLSGQTFSQSERSFLATLGRIAATFIQKNLTVEQLKRTNSSLDKRIYQLTTMLEIGQKLNETLQFDDILKVFSRATMGSFLIGKMAILYSKEQVLEPVFNKGITCTPSIISACKEISVPTILTSNSNLAKDGMAVVVPLKANNEVKGYVLCGEKMTKEPFTAEDLEFFDNVANTLVTQLNNSQLIQERIQKERLEEELRLAHKIQTDLLPSANPTLKSVDIVGSNQPSRQVGGDYYDFIPVNEDWLGIAIGDVSGKGAAAAMLMSNLQASMQALTVNRSKSMTECISIVNSIIYRNTSSEKYITFFYAELNEKTKQLNYVNAGHNYPLLLRNGEITQLKVGGLILGMMEGMPYQSDEIHLEKDDILVFYTDGITEAMNEAEEEFDEPRLIEIMKSSSHETAQKIHSNILNAVFKFSPNASDFDDITLIVLKVAH